MVIINCYQRNLFNICTDIVDLPELKFASIKFLDYVLQQPQFNKINNTKHTLAWKKYLCLFVLLFFLVYTRSFFFSFNHLETFWWSFLSQCWFSFLWSSLFYEVVKHLKPTACQNDWLLKIAEREKKCLVPKQYSVKQWKMSNLASAPVAAPTLLKPRTECWLLMNWMHFFSFMIVNVWNTTGHSDLIVLCSVLCSSV